MSLRALLAAIFLCGVVTMSAHAAGHGGGGGGHGGGHLGGFGGGAPHFSRPSGFTGGPRGGPPPHGSWGGGHWGHGHDHHHHGGWGGAYFYGYGAFGWPYWTAWDSPYFLGYAYPGPVTYYDSYPPPGMDQEDTETDDEVPRARRPTPDEARRDSYGTVQLRGVPDGSRIELDGQYWLEALALDDRWLAIRQGEHTVTIRPPDRRASSRKIDVAPGQSVIVRFDDGDARRDRDTDDRDTAPDAR